MQKALHDTCPVQDQDSPAGLRACDQCRVRKIRCNRQQPCSNCQPLNYQCTFTYAGPPRPRSRSATTSKLEKKIDTIESYLHKIENFESHLHKIENLITNSPLTDAPKRRPVRQQRQCSLITTQTEAGRVNTTVEPEFVGDSGLAVQTTLAYAFLERIRAGAGLDDRGLGIEATILNLRQLVDRQSLSLANAEPPLLLQQPLPPGGVTDLPLPPLTTVMSLLEQVKAGPLSLYSLICSSVGIPDITDYYRKVYEESNHVSKAQFIIINATLYSLFQECPFINREKQINDRHRSYASLCQSNLETALADMDLLLAASTENVQALLLGVFYSIDVAKPRIAWQLVTAAAQLCLRGRFHRSYTHRQNEPHVVSLKRTLFWNTYIFEKAIGLRVGCASSINDCDIDIPRTFEFDGDGIFGTSDLPAVWIKTAYLQGQVYEKLYSPDALESSQEVLIQRAKILAKNCHELEEMAIQCWAQAYMPAASTNTTTPELVELFIKNDQIQFQATLTLVYQVIPAPEHSISRFCTECLEAARKAMSLFIDSAASALQAYAKSSLMHWGLLSTPYAPFFVLFCHSLETWSVDDVKTLQDFVASLGRARTASQSVEKLYALYEILCDIATSFVALKSRQAQDESLADISAEFEAHLNHLGFIPTDQGETGDPGLQAPGTGVYTGDWFADQQTIFSLLEEDLSQIGDKWPGSPGGMPMDFGFRYASGTC